MTITDIKTGKFFETDDLALSAYLICNGCIFHDIKASIIPGKYLFVFIQSQVTEKLSNQFYAFEAKVTPQSYYSAIRDLKRTLAEYKHHYVRRL